MQALLVTVTPVRVTVSTVTLFCPKKDLIILKIIRLSDIRLL